MGELIPGPYGDGLDPDEYEAAIEDAIHFFGCTRETAEANLNGPAVFKAAQDQYGLDFAYNCSSGSIWDLLTVRAAVSSGVKERFREEVIERILNKYASDGGSFLDFGCGIGRELLVAGRLGFGCYGTERGMTRFFADWYCDPYADLYTEDLLDDMVRFPFDVILCLEYLEHDPDPPARIDYFREKLKDDGLLICNSRSFSPHDTGHLEENFQYQYNFEEIIASKGFECLYFPYNPPNLYNICVWKKVPIGQGFYNGATTKEGSW